MFGERHFPRGKTQTLSLDVASGEPPLRDGQRVLRRLRIADPCLQFNFGPGLDPAARVMGPRLVPEHRRATIGVAADNLPSNDIPLAFRPELT